MDLEERLNHVDYEALQTTYRPSQFAFEFINFIKLVNGGNGEENKSPLIHYDMLDQVTAARQNLFVSFRGSAKCLSVDTNIMSPTGLLRLEDIEVGDVVLDRNGVPTKVIIASDIFEDKPCYRIELANGHSFVATDDHVHFVERRTQNAERKNVWVEEQLTTSEIIAKGVYYNRAKSYRNPTGKESKWRIPTNKSVLNFDTCPVYIDPYTLGLMLGDGNFERSCLVGAAEDMAELEKHIPYEISHRTFDKRNPNVVCYRLQDMQNLIKIYSKDYRMVKSNKFIPSDYVNNSVEVRLGLLQGLMDSDGSADKKGSLSFSNMSKALCVGLLDIVISLGGKGFVSTSKINGTEYHKVHFYISQEFPPFKLKRKLDRWINNSRTILFSEGIVDIVPVDPVPTKCIGVASDTHSYITEGGYITHNTSALHEYMILYLATYGEIPDFGEVNVGMYISDTIDNGVKSMRTNLEHRWNNSDFLQKYVPNKRFTDVRWEFTNADGKDLCFRGFGASTGVRGFKEYGQRPTWLGLDDLMSDKNAESNTITKDIKHIIYKAARQAMHPRKRMTIWTGTPFNKSDPLYEAAGSKAWNTRVYPIAEKFPCTREEFRGGWDDRFNYDFVKGEYDSLLESGEIQSFNQELMLRITSDEDRLVQEDDLVWYSRSAVFKDKSRYNFYITTDLATSTEKKSDFSVISVWAYNNNGTWMLVDGICKRQLMDVNINDLFRFCSIYKPLSVGIEINGQQKGFVSWIKSQMIERNIFFNLAKQGATEGIRRTGKKIDSFKLFVPTIKAKKMWLPEEMKETPLIVELLEEVRYATGEGFKSKHDDVCDTLSMLLDIDAYKPSAHVADEYISNESGTYGFFNNDDSDVYKNSTIF